MGNPHEKPKQPSILDENTSRALALLEAAKCSPSAKDTTSKGICALAKARKFGEMAKLHKFTEQLGKKFLSKLDEAKFRTKDPYKLMQAIQKDVVWKNRWEGIMKRLKKAKSYQIRAKRGKNPAEIIFKYANGKTERYPLLELSSQEVHRHAKGITQALLNIGPARKRKALDALRGAGLPPETVRRLGKLIKSYNPPKSKEKVALRDKEKERRERAKYNAFLKKISKPEEAEKYIWKNYPDLLSADGVKDVSNIISKLARVSLAEDNIDQDDAQGTKLLKKWMGLMKKLDKYLKQTLKGLDKQSDEYKRARAKIDELIDEFDA